MVRFDLSRSAQEAATESWRHPLDPDLGGPPPPARPLPPRRDPVLGRTRSVRRSMNYLSYRINIEPSQQRLRRYAGSAPHAPLPRPRAPRFDGPHLPPRRLGRGRRPHAHPPERRERGPPPSPRHPEGRGGRPAPPRASGAAPTRPTRPLPAAIVPARHPSECAPAPCTRSTPSPSSTTSSTGGAHEPHRVCPVPSHRIRRDPFHP